MTTSRAASVLALGLIVISTVAPSSLAQTPRPMRGEVFIARKTLVDPPPEAGGAAGMEYPTLVTTGGDHAFVREGIHLPEFVTIHEIGHNWFQGILASNEFEEA